jgi:hypothetical protein
MIFMGIRIRFRERSELFMIRFDRTSRPVVKTSGGVVVCGKGKGNGSEQKRSSDFEQSIGFLYSHVWVLLLFFRMSVSVSVGVVVS